MKENKNRLSMLVDTLLPPEKTITLHNLSSILKRQGFKVGTPRLRQWMWDNGFLIEDTQHPTPAAMQMGLFKTLCMVTDDGQNKPVVTEKLKVTRRGVELFIKMMLYPNVKLDED